MKFFDKTVSYFISVGECEKLREIEDDRHQEKGESVTKPRLRAETELKAMDRLLQITILEKFKLDIYLGCVERWTGERLLTSNAFINALLHIRPGDGMVLIPTQVMMSICVHLLLYW